MRYMLRFLVFFAICGFTLADSMENAARLLGQKVAARLAADETANVIWRQPVPQNLETALAGGLGQKSGAPKTVEVRVALSENLRGALLIAEILRDGGNIVETVNATRDPAPGSTLALKLTFLWEQEARILDVAFLDGDMLVLDAKSLTWYGQRDGQWRIARMNPINVAPVRDLRGNIDATKNPPVIELPGQGEIFTPGRNTLAEEGWPPHYARVDIGRLHLLAEVDGRTHIYDEEKKPAGVVFDGWGSDFALIASECAGPKIAASEAAGDQVAVYGIENYRPVRLSDPVPLPGPVTALWNHGAGAVVIARNLKTKHYEAYSLSLACGN